MGGSKSSTGIRFVDDTVDTVANGVQKAGQNIEKTTGRLIKSTGTAISTGNFDNFGNTILEAGAAYYTGGQSAALGYKAGDNNVDKLEQKAKDQAWQDNQDSIQAAADAQQRQLVGTIGGIIDQRKRSAGRAMSLLSAKSSSDSADTLLTSNS